MSGEGARDVLASVRDFALDRPGSMVAAILLALIVVFAAVIIRTVRRWFARRLARA